MNQSPDFIIFLGSDRVSGGSCEHHKTATALLHVSTQKPAMAGQLWKVGQA